MIIFDLACEHNHAFEGWFQSPANFESQLADAQIACPNCASTVIRRIPSVLHVGKTDKSAKANKADKADKSAKVDASERAEKSNQSEATSPLHATETRTEKQPKISMHVIDSPAAALAAMQELISIITTQSENVGSSFAQEARKIHYAEAPVRPIRGEVSAKEFDELKDEGIDVLLLPRLKVSTLM